MAIKVTIPAGTSSVSIDPLYQWDYGQILEIESNDFASKSIIVQVHFSCDGADTAVVHACSVMNNIATVQIPDACLEQNQEITAWIYEINGTNGRTTKSVTIPILARPRPNMPSDVAPSENDPYAELIAEINEAVENVKNGQIVVDVARNATEAEHAARADAATTAISAQSAHQANIAASADTAAKLSFQEYMVYASLSFTAKGESNRVCFSFIYKRSTNINDGTTLYSAMPKNVLLAACGYVSVSNTVHNVWGILPEEDMFRLYYGANQSTVAGKIDPSLSVGVSIVPLTTAS